MLNQVAGGSMIKKSIKQMLYFTRGLKKKVEIF